MEFKSNLPYPEIKIEKQNKEYAKILLKNYASRTSEETAIHRYLYQSFETENDYSKIFKEIAIVEMQHLQTLGKLIKMLGINPMFIFPNDIDNGFKYWNSSFLNYENNLEKIFLNNIKEEETTIENYKTSIELIDDIYIKSILNRIIMDEQIHISIFRNLYNNVISKKNTIDNN